MPSSYVLIADGLTASMIWIHEFVIVSKLSASASGQSNSASCPAVSRIQYRMMLPPPDMLFFSSTHPM